MLGADCFFKADFFPAPEKTERDLTPDSFGEDPSPEEDEDAIFVGCSSSENFPFLLTSSPRRITAAFLVSFSSGNNPLVKFRKVGRDSRVFFLTPSLSSSSSSFNSVSSMLGREN